MSNTAQKAAMSTGVARVDMKFEVVVIPVSDVDRAKEFYGRLGWRLDADFRFDNGFHVVQFTPPGSACSIQVLRRRRNDLSSLISTKEITSPPSQAHQHKR